MGCICSKPREKYYENDTTEKNNIINEIYIKGKIENNKVDFDTIDKIRKSVCKIILNEMFGTGFFMVYQNRKFFITCYHVIKPDMQNFEIEIWNKKIKKFEIKNHFIKYFKEFDVTVIELNNSNDLINNIKFLD